MQDNFNIVIGIYIKRTLIVIVVRHLFIMFFLRGNNSALGGHRAILKVANERYCNIVFWGLLHRPPAPEFFFEKNSFFQSATNFFFGHTATGTGSACNGGPKGPIVYSASAGAQRAQSCTAHQPPTGARSEGPIGPRNFQFL